MREAPLLFELRRQPVARSRVRRWPEYKIVLPRPVNKFREPRLPPASKEKSFLLDQAPLLPLPEPEPTQEVGTPFEREGPSHNEEEGGSCRFPHLCDSFLDTQDRKGGATIGFGKESMEAAVNTIFTGLYI